MPSENPIEKFPLNIRNINLGYSTVHQIEKKRNLLKSGLVDQDKTFFTVMIDMDSKCPHIQISLDTISVT